VVKKNIESTKIKILLTKIIHNYEVNLLLTIVSKRVSPILFTSASGRLWIVFNHFVGVDCNKSVRGGDGCKKTVIGYGDGVSSHVLFAVEEGLQEPVHLVQALFVAVV
jgi:hypothetical protein